MIDDFTVVSATKRNKTHHPPYNVYMVLERSKKRMVLIACVMALFMAFTLQVRAFADETLQAGSADMFAVASNAVLETYAGSDRYDTAHRITQAECEKATDSYNGVIIVSCNESRFPDALSAAGLSGLLGYPIVAVNGQSLSVFDRAALTSMKARCPSGSLDILIVGATPAVSSGVESNLGAFGRVSKRFAGADRYMTNQMVFEYGQSHGKWNSEYAFIARGDDYPDALTIAPFLAWKKCPVILVDSKAKTLSNAQRANLTSANHVVALGNEAVVSENVLSEAKSASKRGLRWESWTKTSLAF